MRRFLWFITKEDGRTGKVVNDTVTFTGPNQRAPLPETADGWQEMAVGWERNINDHGINRSFSLPFGYVGDGLKIIRDAIYNQSLEEKLFLLIQVLTLVFVPGVSYNWVYMYLYKGELDLTAAEDGLDMINVPCMEGGLHKQLKANRRTKYTFPFDLEAVTVLHDGIKLDETAHYVVVGPVSNALAFNDHTVPVTFVNNEGLGTGTGFFTQNLEDVPGSIEAYVAASSNYFLINTSGADRTYKIKGVIRFLCTTNSANLAYRLWFTSNGGTADPESVNIFTSGVPLVEGETYEIPVDYSFVLPNGKKYFLFGRFFGAGGVEIAVDYLDGSELNVSFESRGAATRMVAYTKDVLFKKLVKEITGSELNASSLLAEEKKYVVVTSAQAIRGLTDPVITTSLEDFYDDLDATYMAGLGVANNKIEIERRQRYYDTSDPIHLGNGRDVVLLPANEYRANRFKFGHVKQEIDNINGRFDPNGNNEFTGPLLKAAGSEYERISPYKAGPYEIETIRLNLEGKVTTDDSRDNDVYVLHCESNSVINASVSFVASANGFFISIANSQFLNAGQQIQISGSVLNNQIFNILSIGSLILTRFVKLAGAVPVVDEGPIAVTITILRGEVLSLYRPAYTTLEGVPNDTIFNLPDLTPKAMLKAHGPHIVGMHKGLENLKIEFTSGKENKNTELKTVLGGVTIDEDKDETIASLGAPLFLPFFVSFTVGDEIPVDLIDLLEANPNRCFTVYDEMRDVTIEGFLMAAGFAPNDLKEQEFRLLLSPNNDLSLLV